MDSAIETLVGHGVLGTLVVVLGIAYVKLQREYKQAMEDRVADAKKVTETLLAVSEKWSATIDSHRQAIDRFAAQMGVRNQGDSR